MNHKFIPVVLLLATVFSANGANITFNASSNIQYLNSNSSGNPYNTIIINRGAYVVAQYATIFIGDTNSITIEKGGVLKLINSTLTHASSNGLWAGINIKGNPNEDQQQQNLDFNLFKNGSPNYGTMEQGLLYCEGSTLSYAKNAVYSGGITGGGYCYAINSNFYNNANSVYLTNYASFQQASIIRWCAFDNPDYLPTGTTYFNIYLDNASINPNAMTPVFSRNYSQCFTVDGCQFKNSKKYSNLIGNNISSCYVDVLYSNYYYLKVGLKLDRGINSNSGASVVGCNFDRCDRGVIATGLNNLWVNTCTFQINRSVYYGMYTGVVPSRNPVGLYIAGCAHYTVSNSFFDKAASFTGANTGSYGLVVDGNAPFGYEMISNNTFTDVHIGVQSQNENQASFLKCNKFSFGNAATATFSYDVVIASGALPPHDGCGNSGPYYSIIPGNTFSPNSVNSERNIYIPSSNSAYSSVNKFKYYFGSYPTDEEPKYISTLSVKTLPCYKISVCNAILSSPASFSTYFIFYNDAKSRYDSLLQANSTDTGDIKMHYFYKNHYLICMAASITDTLQYDSLVTVLTNDTSFSAKYILLQFALAKGAFTQAQQLVNNFNTSQPELNTLKNLYTILLPVYSNYSFDSLNAKRASIDALSQDSNFGAKQAQYLVNYIDQTNADIAGMENFVPEYIDSILPVEGIDTSTNVPDEYLITVYPNPFQSEVYADIKNNTTDDGTFTMKVFDAYATLLTYDTKDVKAGDSEILKVTTDDLTPGIYYLQFSNKNDEVIQTRIIFKLP